MMFSYPYFNMPYYNRYSRYGYRYPNYTYTPNNQYISTTKSLASTSSLNTSKKTSYKTNVEPKTHENEDRKSCSSQETDSPIFQIFGLDLYFDDILLVCLIFFLYQEGVKDESLFIALILLLLS